MTLFTGRGIDVCQAAVLKGAIGLWASHKIKANRGFQIKAAMALASQITGKTFKSKDYVGAQRELGRWIEAEKLMAHATGDIS